MNFRINPRVLITKEYKSSRFLRHERYSKYQVIQPIGS